LSRLRFGRIKLLTACVPKTSYGDFRFGGPGPNSFGGEIQQLPPAYDAQFDLLSALVKELSLSARAWLDRGIARGGIYDGAIA
jgi:hypothetical protein